MIVSHLQIAIRYSLLGNLEFSSGVEIRFENFILLVLQRLIILNVEVKFEEQTFQTSFTIYSF